MSSIEKTLKKVLKPPRTRSRTETVNVTEECPETTANLAPVEDAGPATGVAWKEFRDAANSESVTNKPKKTFLISINFKLQHNHMLGAGNLLLIGLKYPANQKSLTWDEVIIFK